MNLRLSMIAAAGACTLFASAAAYAGDVLLRYEGAIGSQPLRAGGASNIVAGVAPGGAPWVLAALKVKIATDGTIRGIGRGLLLGGTDNIGTRGGPRQVVASLFCRNAPVGTAVAGTLQTASYDSPPAVVDANGDFTLSGQLANATGAAPPLDCGNALDNRPVLLIRTLVPANAATGAPAAPGAWFAAGVLRAGERSDD